MRRFVSWFAFPALACLGLFCVTLASPGCGGNDNESEFLRTAPPGVPADPEKVADRRSRTRNQSKLEKKNEEKNKAVAEKLKEKGKAEAEKNTRGE